MPVPSSPGVPSLRRAVTPEWGECSVTCYSREGRLCGMVWWQEGSLAEGSVGFSLGTHWSCRHKSPCRLGLSFSPAKWGRLVWSYLAHTDSKKRKTRTKQTNPLGLTFENPRFHIKVGIFPLSRKIGIFGHITTSWQQLLQLGNNWLPLL